MARTGIATDRLRTSEFDEGVPSEQDFTRLVGLFGEELTSGLGQ